MKRMFLLVCLLSVAAIYSYSQSLSLISHQGVVLTNSSVTQMGTPDSLELITYMDVKNITGNSINAQPSRGPFEFH